MYKINNQKDIDKIIELYLLKRYSTIKIGNIFNVSDNTISSILKRNNIIVDKRRCRTPIDSNYFQNINSEAKAYFLGLIAADGSIIKDKRDKIYFSLELNSNDIDILEKLSIEISGNKNIIKTYFRPGRNSTSKISFSDKTFTDSLIHNGIVFNKTINLQFPKNIPDNLMNHYIRGYFDGDGSVYLKNNIAHFNFVGSKSFIPELNKYLFNIGIFNKIYSIIDRGNFCSIHIGGRKMSLDFYNYIYNNVNFFLNRKKLKFESAPYIGDSIRVSSKIGEGCDANTEVSLVED